MDVHLIAPHPHQPVFATFDLEDGAAQWHHRMDCLTASNRGGCSG
jgi:hypothetical protein